MIIEPHFIKYLGIPYAPTVTFVIKLFFIMLTKIEIVVEVIAIINAKRNAIIIPN